MAKKKLPASSKGKPSKNLKQKKGKKGGKTTPQNFRRKKAKDKETDEFDEVLLFSTLTDNYNIEDHSKNAIS